MDSFSSSEIGDVIPCNNHIDTEEYIDIFEKGLLPTINKRFSPVNRIDIFQHDNALPYTLNLTKIYLMSADLNPIENIRSLIIIKKDTY